MFAISSPEEDGEKKQPLQGKRLFLCLCFIQCCYDMFLIKVVQIEHFPGGIYVNKSSLLWTCAA